MNRKLNTKLEKDFSKDEKLNIEKKLDAFKEGGTMKGKGIIALCILFILILARGFYYGARMQYVDSFASLLLAVWTFVYIAILIDTSDE